MPTRQDGVENRAESEVNERKTLLGLRYDSNPVVYEHLDLTDFPREKVGLLQVLDYICYLLFHDRVGGFCFRHCVILIVNKMVPFRHTVAKLFLKKDKNKRKRWSKRIPSHILHVHSKL